MADQHERYEQLAVGHVLGGLDTSEAADFRSHLLACQLCRTRVAELRGIATELEAAERDERARARVQTELPRRADDAGTEPDERRGTVVRRLTVAAVVVLALAGVLAFWNLHLRSQLDVRGAVTEARGDALRELASGVVLPASFGDGVSGVVVVDDEDVAIALTGVADVVPGESLVAWLLDEDGRATVDTVVLARAGPLDDGLVTGVFAFTDAEHLVVTRETGVPEEAPDGEELVRAELRSPEGGSGTAG